MDQGEHGAEAKFANVAQNWAFAFKDDFLAQGAEQCLWYHDAFKDYQKMYEETLTEMIAINEMDEDHFYHIVANNQNDNPQIKFVANLMHEVGGYQMFLQMMNDFKNKHKVGFKEDWEDYRNHLVNQNQ